MAVESQEDKTIELTDVGVFVGRVVRGGATPGGDCFTAFNLELEDQKQEISQIGLRPKESVSQYLGRRVRITGSIRICKGTTIDRPLLMVNSVAPA